MMEMEWDWENLVAFGSKAIERPKKLQLADWTIVDDGSFNLVGGGRHGSSAKSSISASTDSSCKDGMQTTSIFKFSTSEMKAGTSPTPEASVGSAEALLGLKLGKRTYFENSGGGAVKTTSISALKKTRSSGQNAPICCQVEGCNVDLSLAKEYHRKHRVCDSHSKCPKVVVGGRDRRFCQQCSRFHSLSEFDEKKRSCRRRLSDHNARRRKPQQETIQFNSPTPFYGGSTRQMNFLLNNSPLVDARPPPANSAWTNSKFTPTQGCLFKSDADERLHMPGIKVQNAPTSLVLNPDSPEYRRALSLLSSNSWDSCDPESIQLHHQLHENIIQPMIHAIPEGAPAPAPAPFPSADFWSTGPHPTHHHVQSLATFKMPYDTDFYSNLLN